MKLSVVARDELRRKLKEHPNFSDFVANKTAISRMKKEELLDVAAKLGIDVKALSEQANKDGRGLGTCLEPEELDLFRYSQENPAFTGTLEFDLRIEMLGCSLIRKARIVYDYTPEWEYYDLVKQEVFSGWEGSVTSVEILAQPEGEAWETNAKGKIVRRKNTPVWKSIGLIEEGVLSAEIWDALDKQIDEKCRLEDRQRRKDAGID